nr:MAG TPA: hypothetical protein [Bacteriophage sp.]
MTQLAFTGYPGPSSKALNAFNAKSIAKSTKIFCFKIFLT